MAEEAEILRQAHLLLLDAAGGCCRWHAGHHVRRADSAAAQKKWRTIDF
jgi:hypothetical protein